MLDLLRRKKAVAEDGRSPLEILKGAAGSITQLPMLPEAAHKAMAVVNDPNSSLAQFTAVVERDPALAAGILRLANSPLYRVGRTIESLNQAVLRLGLRECQNLIIAVSMRSLFGKAGRTQKMQCEALWAHSFLTGCLARAINKSLELGFRGEEFACGLSHDIGRILMAIAAPELLKSVDPIDFREDAGYLDREHEVLGTDHCYLGAWFANLNHLPHSIISAIQFHHTPAECDSNHGLVGLTTLADQLGNHVHREGTHQGHDLGANPGWIFLADHWDASRRTQFESSWNQICDEAIKEAQEVVKLSS